MQVTYLVTKDSVHLNFNGRHVTLTRSSKEYDEVRLMIKENRVDEIPSLFERKLIPLQEYVEGSGLTLEDGQLKDKEGNVLPGVLSDRLQELKEDGFPVTHLVNFWNNLKQNPSMRSREQLYTFLEQKGHPITEDGHFVAYRGVRSDFKDRHTGTFDNSPGNVLEMPREQVDDDPTRTCSYGFHVAAFEYANGFGQITVQVKVNPRDVVAVPTDYNGQKMRVCRFEVVDVINDMIDRPSVKHAPIDWDAPEPYDSDFVEDVLFWAKEHKNRYTDRSMLAMRIDEEFDGYCVEDYSVSDILTILNENESDWN